MKTRKTKIVCTIGPSCRDRETLERLVVAGMDVARINMSHGTHEEAEQIVRDLREISQNHRPVAIMLDLSGSKIRLGTLKKPIWLQIGDEVSLTPADVEGEGNVLPVQYPPLLEEVNVGDPLSMVDGLIFLDVIEKNGESLKAKVTYGGGQVSSHKGVHLPKGGGSLPALTEKDIEDLRFGLKLGVDLVALSFVRSAFNAELPRKIMEETGKRAPLLAKIEKRQALDDFDNILETFDGVMIARGDLGIEIPFEDVPGIQKDLIRRANRRAKPVITATQMLLSMVSSPRPTRAEVNDVANAILDGTDAVMLSEETAIGKTPVKTVETMAIIARRAETLPHADPPIRAIDDRPLPAPIAIARASQKTADFVQAKLIIVATSSGQTARLIAATRPPVSILALATDPAVVCSLNLSWGIRPRLIEPLESVDHLFEVARRIAREARLVEPGDRIVITAGLPFNVPGTTNLMQVLEV